MRILDILNAPWLLIDQILGDMIRAYQLHLLRDKIDFKEIKDKNADNSQPGRYTVKNGVAIIPWFFLQRKYNKVSKSTLWQCVLISEKTII